MLRGLLLVQQPAAQQAQRRRDGRYGPAPATGPNGRRSDRDRLPAGRHRVGGLFRNLFGFGRAWVKVTSASSARLAMRGSARKASASTSSASGFATLGQPDSGSQAQFLVLAFQRAIQGCRHPWVVGVQQAIHHRQPQIVETAV
jgi:hypothetical protein